MESPSERGTTFLMFDHCSPSTVRSKTLLFIPREDLSPPHHIIPSFCPSPQWIHLPEYLSGVVRSYTTYICLRPAAQPGHRTKTMSLGLIFTFIPDNDANLLALKIVCKVVDGKIRTNLRKGPDFFISRWGSLIDF